MARSGTPLLIMRRVQARGRGWVFSPRDFLDLAARATVDQALKRMCVREMVRDPQTEGHLEFRRIGHGLYEYPRWDFDGKAPPPDADQVVRAITRRDGHRITRSGAHHAHALGLTELGAGARAIFLTDGPDRLYRLGDVTVELVHAGPRTMAWANRPAGPVVLALMWLGPQLIEPAKETLRARGMKKSVVRDLQDNLWMAPSYMQPALRELVGAKRKRRTRRGKSASAQTETAAPNDRST